MHRPSRLRSTVQWVGLIAGPALALFAYAVLPHDYVDAEGTTAILTTGGRATLAVMAWMAVWWLTEAIDISATALLPLAAFPLLGIADMTTAAAPYAHELIFLFMGGFLLALSMQRWGLDRRIALITLRLVGTRPVNMVAGFMIATGVLSAFVSNTATAAMMMPIATSVIGLVTARGPAERPPEARDEEASRNFALCLMLGIAYAASIGGIATIIGSPPNAILVGFIADSIAEPYRQSISFVKWMTIGAPLAAVFLPFAWWLLTRVIFPVGGLRIEGGPGLLDSQLRALGAPKSGEWVTLIVFCCTALAWMLGPWLRSFVPGLSDAGIAMCGGLVLFLIPVDVKERAFVMTWKAARDLPWGILILFGGGLSLAAAVAANGVAEFLGSLATNLSGLPGFAAVLLVCTGIIFLTELTSNTATVATLVPVLAALAPGIDLHPYRLIVPAALAASCAFMMPVATPPNAIVFGTGHVTIRQMARAGLWLNVAGIVLITLLSYSIIDTFLEA